VAEALAQRTVGGLHEALLPHLSGLPKEAQILDLGCGTGAWLARLASAGFVSLTGVDQAPPPASAFAWPPPRLMQADLDHPDALAALHGTWDVVTAIEVVEHVANQGQFWDLVAALLKPGALALVTTPNLQSLPARLRWLLSGKLRQFDDHGDPTHVTPVFLPLLPKLLAPRGLMIEATWPHPARGYLAMRPALNLLFRMLSFADKQPGDTLCLRIRKRSAV
jgi:2-polyprenyl-3-methyl-5-hydroxy-6-metoxy-1,4-benzoquinol methylase